MLVSVLTPFYAPDPRTAEVAAAFERYLGALAGQDGPLEVIVAGTGPARRDPLRWLAERDFPHPLRTLHHRFDPDRARPQSRAEATNAAAAAARGEVLLILHADVLLPAGAIAAVRQAVAGGWRAGVFPKRYDRAGALLHRQEQWLNAWHLGRGRHSVGTNAVWLVRELWQPLPAWRLLEDVWLSDRLRRDVGRRGIHLADRPVTVSADKYRRTGVLPSMAVNSVVLALFKALGVSPDVLRDELYDRRRLAVGTPAFWLSLVRQTVVACRRGAPLLRS